MSNYEKDKDLTLDDVLGLDIATHTGYYSTHESGTWDFTESMRRNNNKQHSAFRETLIAFIEKYGIKRIVAEDVAVNQHFIDTRKLSEFRGILMEVCDTLDLPEPTFVNPSTLKKWATGNGRATKTDMMKTCIKRWKTSPVDDNEADATHLFMYFVKKFNIRANDSN